jgi:hypothetical protein
MSSGPAAVQRKQMRHCWFTLMLYCPARSPRNFSSRLPGGILASSRVSAASNINNLRSAARWVCWSSRCERSRRQTRSVSLSAKERSTSQYNATRYYRATLWACSGRRGRTSHFSCCGPPAARCEKRQVAVHQSMTAPRPPGLGMDRHQRNAAVCVHPPWGRATIIAWKSCPSVYCGCPTDCPITPVLWVLLVPLRPNHGKQNAR